MRLRLVPGRVGRRASVRGDDHEPVTGGRSAGGDELCVDSTQGPARSRSFTVLRRRDEVLRLDTDVLVGLLVSSEHLTVGTVTVNAGQESREESHAGEELLYVTRGALRVSAGGVEATLTPGDGFLIPAGTPHTYAAESDHVAEAIFGVAPTYAASVG